jgi:uncharacterized membrane protein YedE/YeeE
MRNKFQIIYKGPWAYWVGALVLAILNMLVLIFREVPWGITTNIEAWSVWLGSNIGLLKGEGITLKQLLLSDGTYLNLGVILGAFWGTLAASQARLRHVKNVKFLISALLGGLLMGYGARIASGCSIGQVLNGIASSSVSGWLFTIALFIGAWIGSKIIVRFLL